MISNDMAVDCYDNCLVCGNSALKVVVGFSSLPRITSDCRPFPAGGFLAVCQSCGTVQKRPDQAWLKEIGEIYAGYASYYQSGGDEQIVFDRLSGRPRRRSDVILEKLVSDGAWPTRGSALDVGCGNGVTLSSMSSAFTGWRFNGFEIGEGARARLETIPGFERLFTGSFESIRETFDLVTMIHSLEHFPSPQKALTDLQPIVGNGKIFIEVCNVEENPFDILVADHLIHFSPATLSRLLAKCGFVPVTLMTDWVPKEISALAQTKEVTEQSRIGKDVGYQTDGQIVYRRIEKYVSWLNGMVESVREHSRKGQAFGIFGTSIAATWVASQLGDHMSFFVDEDESRIGKQHMGRPIFHPRDVPPDSTVYLALAPGVAEIIKRRLAHLTYTLVSAPAMAAD